MTGFRLPAKAVEALLREYHGTDWPRTWPHVSELAQRARMRRALSAALSVLAESPEFVAAVELAMAGNTQLDITNWGNSYELDYDGEGLLRDLFAAAPTDTTEENTDG